MKMENIRAVYYLNRPLHFVLLSPESQAGAGGEGCLLLAILLTDYMVQLGGLLNC